MTEPTPAPRRRPRWMAAAALSAAFLAGGITVSGAAAVAQGMGGHMMGHDSAHMMAHFNMALDAVGATPDQKTRIDSILHAGMAPMMSTHAGMSGAHSQLIGLLTAPTIDRGAVEQVRSSEIAQLDAASRAMAGSLEDAAAVLTPEQRAKLAELVREHHPAS